MCKNALITTCLIIGLSTLISGCEPHRIDIQQGNAVKPEMAEKLKIGMTRKQVVFLLGTPSLSDPFHQDRWDYIYYLKPGNRDVKYSRLTLYFENDKLVKIDDQDYTPEVHEEEMEAPDEPQE